MTTQQQQPPALVSIDVRATQYHCWGMAAYDTLPALADRCDQLMANGRRVTLIRQWIGSPTIEAHAGLTADTRVRADRFGLHEQANPVGRYYEQHLTGLRGFGFSGYVHEGDEPTQLARYRSDRPNTCTMVAIQGWGDGVDDRIDITSWNQYGVGELTVVVFDRGPGRHGW